MPDTRKHRGPHPDDRTLFSADQEAALAAATTDLSWLLGRGYTDKASLKLVGDRHGLDRRQRLAVWRCACSDEQLALRRQRCLSPERLAGRDLHIDGFNVLTTVEAALAGGVILHARDGCFRDMASMHGSWRRVAETAPAVELVGRSLAPFRPATVTWFLDQPVSNSGRLRQLMRGIARDQDWNWQVELVPDVDRVLLASPDGVALASADSAVLDRAGPWLNLARHVVAESVAAAWVVGLSSPPAGRGE